ncbi:hypothetical protein ACIGW0_28120 [Streptomyces bikiniensis]|uniref:Uncharacterized protein n=1 Tax=Streptomyces bikiniensis TaxID=1896 RepID=A0ABW8D2I9_STRBI
MENPAISSRPERAPVQEAPGEPGTSNLLGTGPDAQREALVSPVRRLAA